MKRTLDAWIGIGILPLNVMPPAQGAEGAGAAYVVTYIETLTSTADRAAELLRQLAAASRKESGNLRFEVLQRIHQPDHFAILEAWADTAAHSAHTAANHTRDFLAHLHSLLRAPYDARPHTALSVGAMTAAAAGGAKGELYAVTHVDVVPAGKEQGVEAVKKFAEAGRKATDNIRFEALTQASRPNHMTVIEIWKDQKAAQAHAAADHARRFREQLLPISGSLYDERFYRNLH
jgi:quinol monooxygenase YgiN